MNNKMQKSSEKIISQFSESHVWRRKHFYLCSSAVIEHFPSLERSKPFKSGYEHDKEDVYYIIATYEWEQLFDYYERVIICCAFFSRLKILEL